jgi:hypothetical protein
MGGGGATATEAVPTGRPGRLPKAHVIAPDGSWEAPNEGLLLDEVFTTATVYDALSRVMEAEAPQTTGRTGGSTAGATSTHARRTRYLYHEGGALQGVEARYEGDTAGVWTPYVDDIRYNARGQRMRVDYASGAKTHYDYDERTFRLRMLKHTVVATEIVEGEPTSVTKTAMHCTYTYDPVGNLVQVRDESVPTGERVLATLAPNDSLYAYDALYRLVNAIGREHPANTPPDPTPEGDGNGGPGGTHPNDLTALARYEETFDYDCVVEERHYLGGYEVLRKHAGDSVEDDISREVQTLHVMDGDQRVVMVTTKTVDTSGAGATTVYAEGAPSFGSVTVVAPRRRQERKRSAPIAGRAGVIGCDSDCDGQNGWYSEVLGKAASRCPRSARLDCA